MWKAWLLTCVLTLQVLRGVLGENCAPCHQVDCRPLPVNCKYGVTYDRCGCCKVCVQSNGERCRFITDANGIGFICEWGPVTAGSKCINNLITSQLQHPVGLDAFFRAFFNITKPSNNNRQAEVLMFNVQAKRSEHPKVVDNVEHFKAYPTCGLYDYLTSEVTRRYEAATEKSQKAAKTSGKDRDADILNDNVRLSNMKGSFVGLDSKLLINEAQAMRKTNKIQQQKVEELKSKQIKKQKPIDETFKFKHDIGSFIDALKHMSIYHDLDGTRGDSRRSSHVRQHMNINLDHQGNNGGIHHGGDTEQEVMQTLDASDRMLKTNVEMVDVQKSGSVQGANSYSLTRGRPNGGNAMAKTGEVEKMLGETISDIMAMFVKRARVMHAATQDVAAHGNAETKQNKTDPIRLLGYLLKKNQQAKLPSQSDRRMADAATDISDKKFVVKDPDSSLRRRSNVFSNLIDGHHRISSRKSAHDKKDVEEEGSLMGDSDFSSNEVEQLPEDRTNMNIHTELKHMALKATFHKKTGPFSHVSYEQNEEEDSDNSVLKEPSQELEDDEWDDKKLASGSYMNKLLYGGPQRSLQPRTYYVRQMLKHMPRNNKPGAFTRGSRWREEGNKVKRSDGTPKNRDELLSRKKRNAPATKEKTIALSAEPKSYGTFAFTEDGKVQVVSSNVARPQFEELLSKKFPGRVIFSQQTDNAQMTKPE